MCELSKRLGFHRPRTKYLDVQKANLTYRKQRKRTKSQTRKMTRRLLELLGKILKEIRRIERENEDAESMLTVREKGDLEIITKLYRQQKKIGGDTGYAGTSNMGYCKENGIQTSFVKRGRPFGEGKKNKETVRQELARVRATAMEGSFGTQKEHYDLKRIKARTKQTEVLYIFFGIHTANVVQLLDRIDKRAREAAA